MLNANLFSSSVIWCVCVMCNNIPVVWKVPQDYETLETCFMQHASQILKLFLKTIHNSLHIQFCIKASHWSLRPYTTGSSL